MAQPGGRRSGRVKANTLAMALALLLGQAAAEAQSTAAFPDVEESAEQASDETADDTVDVGPDDRAAPPPQATTSEDGARRVEPPRLLTTEPVAYPESGRGDAAVVLELLVGQDGGVREASVVSGAEPFATAALEAARRWRFEPAAVDGKPQAARIRVATKFEQVAVVEEGEDEGGTETSEAPDAASSGEAERAPAAPAPKPIEVVVEGEKRVVGKTTLSKLEIRDLPGAFGDPFRAVEALPGVTPLVSGLPFYFIRGSPPGNQGYFFDGVRVPLLYHLALGPGVIHPELVDRVDLYAGGYPARYGRFIGGVVAAESAPPLPDFHGNANVRLVDSGALVSAPFADGRGTATLAGRYSYTAAMVRLIEPSVRLKYWDYQSRVRWKQSERSAFEVFAFGSFDLFRQLDESNYHIGTEFHRVDLRHDFVTEQDVKGRLAVTLGSDRSREQESEELGVRTVLRDRMAAARLELEKKVGPRRTHRGGGDVTVDYYDVVVRTAEPDSDTEQLAEFFPTRTDVDSGVWSDVVLEVTPRLDLVAGGRVDLFVADGVARLGIDPRVAATFTVHDKVRLVHAFGIAHQPPSFVVPVPGFDVAGLERGLQRGVQSSAGIEWDLPANFSSSLTLFQHAVFNGTDLLSVATQSEAFEDEGDLNLRSFGHTYGAELMVRRPATQRIGALLAYTLSRSTRSFGRFSGASSFDRRHVLNASLAFNLGRRWRAGTRFVYYSGFPVQVSSEEWVSEPGGGHSRPLPPQLVRTQPFYRIDWRIQKRWPIGSSGAWWAFTAEVLNTTLHKEEISPACPDGSCAAELIGPVTIPAIGVEAAF